MIKRKLDTKRLYKLTKIGVIVLTLFIILKFVLFDWNAFQSVENTFFSAGDTCYSQYGYFSTKYVKCREKADRELTSGLDAASQIQIHDLLLIVLMPTMFFGGGLLYKYLFPDNYYED